MNGLLGFALIAVAIVAVGCGVAGLLFRRLADEAPPRIELLVTGALIGLALWIAANWALAITLILNRRNLLIVVTLFALGTLASRPAGWAAPRRRFWPLLTLLAIALWSIFVLWRGAVVPPASYDVLTYHLPKAVMILKAEGLARFDIPDLRIRTFPSNYELLLADVLILGRSDRLTEWIGTASYLLFLGVVATYARRWWGAGVHVATTCLAAAGAPLLLLHSGHDKNDLLTAVYAAAAIFWSARWCARRGSLPALLAILFGVTAIGTKMTAGAVAIGVAPFGIAAIIRKPPRPRAFAGAAAFAVVALLLCGGWVFVQNATGSGGGSLSAASALPTSQYGQWRHLWLLPYLIGRVSLGLSARVPESDVVWPWPAENVFSSHYGFVFGLALLALPFCLWRYRGDAERAIAGGAAAIAFFVLLPLIQYPQTTLPSILRYTVFVLPVVYGWTIAPVTRELEERHRRIWVHLMAAVLLAVFAFNAIDMAMNDAFAPFAYARWCAEHPGTREIYWMSGRAAVALDRMAGPRDKVAVYMGPDTWLYPAYGTAWLRTLVFVSDPHDVPPDAQWVMIDNVPSRLSGPAGVELRFYDTMRTDNRFRLVYRNDRLNQAVFRRIIETR